MTTKEIRLELQRIAFDSVRRSREGVWSVKYGYFYRHGNSPQSVWERIKNTLPSAELVNLEDRFNQWPKDSYFLVEFKVTTEACHG